MSYSRSFRRANGDTDVTAEVMLILPSSTESAVVACAELRFGGATWDETLPLSLEELYDLFAAAWLTASETLPRLVIPGRARARWARVPVVELRLTAEHRHNDPGPHKSLADYVDFSQFGSTDRDHLTVMAITIAVSAVMSFSDRSDLTLRAMERMGRGFGYLNARAEHIRSSLP